MSKNAFSYQKNVLKRHSEIENAKNVFSLKYSKRFECSDNYDIQTQLHGKYLTTVTT